MVSIYNHLLHGVLFEGSVYVGPESALTRDNYKAVVPKKSVLGVGKGAPIHVAMHAADIQTTHMHGKEHHWVALVSRDDRFSTPHKFLRLDPASDTISLTSLFDSTAKWLVSFETHDNVAMVKLHGTAFGLHQTRAPLHSVNALTIVGDELRLVPQSAHTQFLFLVRE